MTTAGARPLREDEPDLSRDAVLLEWERKLEAADRRTGRFDRVARHGADGAPARVRPAPVAAAGTRRTITITGQAAPPRRRPSVAQRQLARPDRVALWAFLLCLFLVAVAAATAHA
jgi:hypothetical protein